MTATAYNNLAAIYEGMGKYDKAEPLFQKGLKLLRTDSDQITTDRRSSRQSRCPLS